MLFWVYRRGESARPPYGFVALLAVILAIMVSMVRGPVGYTIAALILLDMIVTTPAVVRRERAEKRLHSLR